MSNLEWKICATYCQIWNTFGIILQDNLDGHTKFSENPIMLHF